MSRYFSILTTAILSMNSMSGQTYTTTNIKPPGIKDYGYDTRVKFYCDVNNDGIKDYGRLVGGINVLDKSNVFLSFALGKKDGTWVEYGYNSAKGIDYGYLYGKEPQTMKDVDNDGFLDYCRKVGDKPNFFTRL